MTNIAGGFHCHPSSVGDVAQGPDAGCSSLRRGRLHPPAVPASRLDYAHTKHFPDVSDRHRGIFCCICCIMCVNSYVLTYCLLIMDIDNVYVKHI